jgi:hypothetical protein
MKRRRKGLREVIYKEYLQRQATRVFDSVVYKKLRDRCGVDNGRIAGLTSGSRVAARLDFQCGVLPGVPPRCGKAPIDEGQQLGNMW